MIIRLNGNVIFETPHHEFADALENPRLRPTILRAADRALAMLGENKWQTLVLSCVFIMAPTAALAAGQRPGGWKIIHMLQCGAFWVGLAVSIWGVYEWQVGGPGWKQRITMGFIGYVLVMILPLLFLTVQDSLGGQ